MFRGYLLQSWRNISRHKTSSLLNIIGLSGGLTCFIFIALWVAKETSVDKFHHNYDRIVRVTTTAHKDEGLIESALTSAPIAKVLQAEIPEVQEAVRFDMHEEIVRHNGQQFLEAGILVADPSIFDIFSFHLLKGDKSQVLQDPYSLVLTETTAKKYFGDNNPVGETLVLNMYDSVEAGSTYTITGIAADPPSDGHFKFNMIASFKTVERFAPQTLTAEAWKDHDFYTYLLLKKNVRISELSKKITALATNHLQDTKSNSTTKYSYHLQPLKDIYLRSHLRNEIAAVGSISRVYIFSTIGLFILLLAGINYVNLATARSASRAKEVGIKKVSGARKQQLIFQYITEAVLTSVLAFLFALVFSWFLKPVFGQLSGKDIELFSNPSLLLFLLAVTVFLGAVSGIYPAMVFSGFKPIQVLKGTFQTSRKGIALRKSLVVIQFIITIVLVTAIIIIYSQLSYIERKDLGYNPDGLIVMRVHGNTELIRKYEIFKNDLLNSPLIKGVTTSNSLPFGGFDSQKATTVDESNKPVWVDIPSLRADPNYIIVYGIQFAAGSNYRLRSKDDTIVQLVINEEAVKKIGWKNPQSALGKPMSFNGQKGEVVGVIKNFHFNALKEVIEPMVMVPTQNYFSRITIKSDTERPRQTIDWLEKTWKKHFPHLLLDYDFLTDQRANQYKSEARFSKIFTSFSIVSLLIASLGLYGLVAYTTSQKRKEIGIRKVLGATPNRIAFMLSFDFLKLIVVASLVAIPASGMIMQGWLQNFAYRTEIAWWMFAIAFFAVMLVAIGTVGFKAITAAMTNPADSLKTE